MDANQKKVEVNEFEIGKATPMFYVNNTMLNMSTNDLVLNFFMRIADSNQEQVRVIMSPQYAKTLVELLDCAIKDYEDAFGEINLDPKDLEEIEED